MEARLQYEIGGVIPVIIISLVLFVLFRVGASTLLTGGFPLVLTPLVGALWVASMALLLALVKSQPVAGALIILPALGVAIIGSLSPVANVGALLAGLALYSARRSLTRDLKDRLVYRTRLVFRTGVKLLVLGLLLAAASFFLPALELTIGQQGLVISDDIVAAGLAPIEPVLQSVLPDITGTTTVDQFIEQQLAKSLGETEGTVITAELRQALRQDLAKQLGEKNLNGNESLAQLVARKINTPLHRLSQTSPTGVALLIVVGALLAARALIPLAGWLVTIGLVMPMVWLGRASGWLTIADTVVTAQRLDWR